MKGLSLKGFGHATSLLLALSFAVCAAFNLLFPNHGMFKAWEIVLPGFQSLSVGSFFLGVFESYAFGWYIALIWVPIYNVVTLRRQR